MTCILYSKEYITQCYALADPQDYEDEYTDEYTVNNSSVAYSSYYSDSSYIYDGTGQQYAEQCEGDEWCMICMARLETPHNSWQDFQCFAFESPNALWQMEREHHDALCGNDTGGYNVTLIETEHRFHNHFRHIITNFTDQVDLSLQVRDVQRGYRQQHEKTLTECNTDGFHAIRHHIEKTAVVLPCISLFVCLATLYVLSYYFKRSKRILVHINLITAIVLNQATFIATMLVKELYAVRNLDAARKVFDSNLFSLLMNHSVVETVFEIQETCANGTNCKPFSQLDNVMSEE